MIVIAFTILLLNLIIAMLANTYNIFDGRSNGLFLSKILMTRDEMNYDENYGAFFSSMPPLNCVQAPFLIPALVLPLRHPILTLANELLMRLQYCIFMILHFSYFAIFTFVLAVPSYFIGVLQKVKKMKDPNMTAADRFENILFFPLGPIIVVFNCLADCMYFWKNNFR